MPDPIFPSGAALQDVILQEAGPDTLTVVSHQRLAHQIWHRQRLSCLKAGHRAWEPVSLVTLKGWWADLFRSLWPAVSLAPALSRLAFWREALKAAPAPPGGTGDLKWAQALDEAHDLLARHLLPTAEPSSADPPVVAWRRQVTRKFVDLLHREEMITPGELAAFLLKALDAGRLTLPAKVFLAGFQTPAPAEEAWLQAVARRTRVVRLQVKGDFKAVHEAVVLPERGQELEWVAAEAVEAACREGLPGHRLAITSMALDSYAPHLIRLLSELVGPPQGAGGWAYNFSKGPSLADTPLFQAALLPLKFLAQGERRQDLISLLLSPYYGGLTPLTSQGAALDCFLRDRRLDRGWTDFRQAVAQDQDLAPAAVGLLDRLDRAWGSLRVARATGLAWVGGLQAFLLGLGFPGDLNEAEMQVFGHLTTLMRELEGALAQEVLSPSAFLEWLAHGAAQELLPGPGVQEAGLQVLGLLEMRGLDFDRVWCLGMNSGTLPAPPRPLPLLNAREKAVVLGGTYRSQHHFAQELYETFLGTAPRIVLTRPRVEDQEERVATSLYKGEWRPAEMAPLSRPHRAWLRVPAVQAAFAPLSGGSPVAAAAPAIPLTLPTELAITEVQAALTCPCRFLLENLLNIKELAEIEAGLDPRERGARLHQVLARFTREYLKVLDQEPAWNQARALKLLKAAARQVLAPVLKDLHWQAERQRWLGEADAAPGLLQEWLHQEKELYDAGWRWLGVEARFEGLTSQDWPFTLKGRIDRLDGHVDTREVVVWDYKSGEVPGPKKVFTDLEEHQLPGYLLAVKQGRVAAAGQPKALKAGFIGLKSARQKHLKYQDFKASWDQWQPVVAAWEERLTALGQRLKAGDFAPRPAPAPQGSKPGACRYCPYPLICGFSPPPAAEPEEEEEGQ
jgi:RecB family exonuclease